MMYLFILVGVMFFFIYLTCYVDYKIYKRDWFYDDEDYKYLVKMPMDSVSKENVDRLLKDKGEALAQQPFATNQHKDVVSLDVLGYKLVSYTDRSALCRWELDRLGQTFLSP